MVGLAELLLSKVEALLAADSGEMAGVVEVTIIRSPPLARGERLARMTDRGLSWSHGCCEHRLLVLQRGVEMVSRRIDWLA